MVANCAEAYDKILGCLGGDIRKAERVRDVIEFDVDVGDAVANMPERLVLCQPIPVG